jgi:hypothetical protein
MSERERWIVYPLLLFALGAAVRDKLMDRVEAKEIRCERLQIVDQQDPDKSLAELGFKRAINGDPTRLADRVGALILKDSDGREICDISHDVIVGRVIARQLAVIDEMRRPLVVALTEPLPVMTPGQGDGAVSYQGVIYLNNQRLGIRLAPPTNQPATSSPPANPVEASPEANP